ncbi:MAG: phosphodiester glycosidase family protein [Spirochaetaceae bacterium]|nr:phosphodiester glycosidase family protein [Spirochaetaceae bacterium]
MFFFRYFYPLTLLRRQNRPQNTRTCVGTVAKGRILYLLVAEGEYPAHSRGMTFEESAEWLLWLGAEDGLSLMAADQELS